MQTSKIISVTSLAAHRTSGLKAQMAVLGSAVLPVPTIVLNGVTSFSTIHKQTIDLEPLLHASMELAMHQKQKIYLFVGYLATVQNAEVVEKFIVKYKNQLSGIFVDPISGDNNKIYVDHQIVDFWPRILAMADVAFPNITELRLFSGLLGNSPSDSFRADAFAKRFPNLKVIVTSYIIENRVGIMLMQGSDNQIFLHKMYKVKFDGTGDVFASFFLKNYIIHELDLIESCRKALNSTLVLIKQAYRKQSNEIEFIPKF